MKVRAETMRKIHVLFIVMAFFLWAASSAMSASVPLTVGGVLPEFSLTTPKDRGERNYLNLSFISMSFKVPELKTQVVLIEIFSMYCPYCQAEASNVNRLYEKIEASPALKGKIKVIGIGVGNSPFEVGVFKKKYNIVFPLFPDGDFKIHKLMGEVRTPYFIGVKINSNGSHQVFYSRLRALGNVDKFLNEIDKLSGIK
jgi:peroxiredoxin